MAAAQFASWGNRVVSTLVRSLIFLPAYLIVLIALAINDGLGIVVLLAVYVFAIAAYIRMLIQRGHLGYDAGDRVSGQHLIKEATGAPMGSGGATFVRALVHVIDALPCYLGYLWPLWDAKRQTFADKAMGTVVVKGRPQTHDAKALIVNALQFWTPVTKG